jgi:hypothetical protein
MDSISSTNPPGAEMSYAEFAAIAAAAAKGGDIAPPASTVPTNDQVRTQLGWRLIETEHRG